MIGVNILRLNPASVKDAFEHYLTHKLPCAGGSIEVQKVVMVGDAAFEVHFKVLPVSGGGSWKEGTPSRSN